eukprot:1882240-Amphidinium_carterae.1
MTEETDRIFLPVFMVPWEDAFVQEYVKKLENAGVKALFVTVDAPQLGRREKDSASESPP